jgi:DegV family protein with EDD domain
MKTVLFCDSNCELWHDLVQKYNLNVISMPYVLDGAEHFYDMGKNTDFKDFYSKIRKGSVPTTSALNEALYIEYFEPHLKKGSDIIYISFSHKLSATFDSMASAITELKKKYPERTITCIDSKSISMGAGIIVLLAARKFCEATLTDAEFIKYVEGLIEKSKAYFTVDDLHHLKRGGRISGAKAVIGSLLKIKPLLKVSSEGRLENYGKAKGRKSAIAALIDACEKENIDPDRPVVLSDADASDADLFAGAFRAKYGDVKEFICQQVGPVIGAHCGPGTLAVLFFTKV